VRKFQRWYDEAKQRLYIGTEEGMPMIPRLQCNRSNSPADTPILLFGRSIGTFFKYLTAVAEPFLCRQLSASECFAESFESWHDDLPTPRSLNNELSRWFNMWSRQSYRVDSSDILMKSLASADLVSFPNIRIVLGLRCTLPATSAAVEHSFSVLMLIKSHLI